jgi:hypothetical protein
MAIFLIFFPFLKVRKATFNLAKLVDCLVVDLQLPESGPVPVGQRRVQGVELVRPRLLGVERRRGVVAPLGGGGGGGTTRIQTFHLKTFNLLI